jgi:hypothetical protein
MAVQHIREPSLYYYCYYSYFHCYCCYIIVNVSIIIFIIIAVIIPIIISPTSRVAAVLLQEIKQVLSMLTNA